jgi:chromosome segregation ATPase
MYNRSVLGRGWNVVPMPSLDERVAYLEGRLEDHSDQFNALRNDVSGLRQEMAGLRHEVADLRHEMAGVRNEMTDLRDAIAQLRVDVHDRMNRQLTWTAGIQIGMLIAIVSALLRR